MGNGFETMQIIPPLPFESVVLSSTLYFFITFLSGLALSFISRGWIVVSV